MGYPMTWARLLDRNMLCGNYSRARSTGGGPISVQEDHRVRMISGDLRRLEQDSVDGQFATAMIAARSGVDATIVGKVLAAFFHGAPPLAPHDDIPNKEHGK